jgi:hypothetical protein
VGPVAILAESGKDPSATTTYWIPLIVAALGSSVIAGLLSTVLGNARATANIRRDRYGQAVRGLVAWGEYPYRIRRRTDDEPATLAALAERGHAIQEQLAESRGWVAAESRTISEVFDTCIRNSAQPSGQPANRHGTCRPWSTQRV